MTAVDPARTTDHRSDSGPAPLLGVDGLRVGFPTRSGIAVAVNDVSLTVGDGEVLGLVGESGSGKSVTCRAVIGIVPHPGAILGGHIEFDGRDVSTMRPSEMRELRAHDVAMIFQDSTSSLNPVFTIGHQISEVLRVNQGLGRKAANRRSVELLDRVGIPAPAERMGAYPHELSGGMRQRVMIAMAVAGEPRLLIADEPTTALDVTVQHQVLRLLDELRRETGMAMILVSHDMGVIAEMADRVAVMYAGRIVEVAPVDALFRNPSHPYTRALIEQVPRLAPDEQVVLSAIAGQPPDLVDPPPGCAFAPRCPEARDECAEVSMELIEIADGHLSACPYSEVDR